MNAGDIVIGDEDGVVIVPFAQIDPTLARLPIVRAAESDLDAKVPQFRCAFYSEPHRCGPVH